VYVLRAADDSVGPIPGLSITECTIGSHASLRLDALAAAAAALGQGDGSKTDTELDALYDDKDKLHSTEDILNKIPAPRPMLHTEFSSSEFAREVYDHKMSPIDYFASEASCAACVECQRGGNCSNVWKLNAAETVQLLTAAEYTECIGIARRINYTRSSENAANDQRRAECIADIARYSGAVQNTFGTSELLTHPPRPELTTMHFGSADHQTAAAAIWTGPAKDRMDAIVVDHKFIKPFATVFYTCCAPALEPARVLVTGPRVNHRATECVVDSMFVATMAFNQAVGMAYAVLNRIHGSGGAVEALRMCVARDDHRAAAAAADLVLACKTTLHDNALHTKAQAAAAEQLCSMLAGNLVRLTA
jgi:hypothetical protein